MWDKPDAHSKNASKKLNAGKSKLKQWKDHVQQWGLDEEYKHHLAIGGMLNSNGWSGCIYYIARVDKDASAVWQLSFSEIKHDKQRKQLRNNTAFPQFDKPSEFVFGKVNNLYTLQLGYGREKLLLPGVVEGNVSVSFRYSGGFSMAMLKPYYLKLIYADYSQPEVVYELREEAYSESNADIFLKEGNIFGSGKWNHGLNEMRMIPGLFLETAFVIEPAPDKGFVQTITLGANGAFYTKPLPVMADIKAYRWQASLFVGLALGKRWK